METLTQITNYLASQSWQIALLSVAVAAVSLLLKNRSSHVRYLLWLVVLAKCLVPSLFTLTLAVLPQPMSTEDAPPAATTPVFEVPEIESAVLEPAVFRAPALPESELAPIYSTSTPVPPVSEPTVTDKLAKVSARQWLALGWAAGAVLFMAVVSIKALRTNLWLKARRRALPAKLQGPIADFFAELGVRRAPKVWMVAGIGQPFVWGLLRGAIYLPTDFKSNARRSHRQVLAHELSHVLRFDAAVNLLQIVAQAFYWFHPFVWWANKKIRAEREKSCDETAIARLNAVPKDYSRAIVNILVTEHNSARPVPSLAIAGPIRNIEDRIRTIMKSGKKFYRRPSIITVVVVAILAAVAVPTTLALTSIPVPEPSAPGTEAAGKAIEQITDAQKIRLDVGVTRAEATVAEPGDEIVRNVYENFLFLRRDDTVVLALVGEDGFDLTDIWRNKGLHVMGWEPLAAVRGKLYGIRWAANQLLEIDLASGQCGIVTNSFAPYYYHPQSGRLYSTKKLANGYRLVVYDLVKGIWRDVMESPFREEMVRFTHIAVSLDERFVAFPEPIAEELEGFSKVKDVVLVDSNGTQSGLRGTFPLFPPLFRLVFADLESGRVTRLPWEFVYAPSGGYSGIDAFPIGRGISIHRRPNQIAWYDSKTVLVVRMDNPVNGRPRVGLAAFDIETGQMQNVAALPMISTLNLMGSITQQGDEDVRLVGTASAVPNTYRVDLKAGPLIEDNSTASIGGAFRCEGGNILWGDKAIEGSKGASSVVVSPDGRRILWRRAPSRKGKDRYDVLCWDSVKGGVAVVAAENAREGVGLMWVGKSDLVKAETSEPPMPWQRITATPWPKPEPRGPDKRPKVTDLLSMELKTGANWGEAVRTEDIDATVRDVLYETYDIGTTMWSPMTGRLFAERLLDLMQKQAPAQKLFAIAASGTDAQKKALLESVKRMCEVYLNKLPDFESDPDVPWRATVVHSPGVMVYPPLLLQLEDDPAQTLDIVTRMYLRGQDARAKFRRARGAREHIGWGTSDTGTIMAYVCDSCMTRLDSDPCFNNQATAGQLRALQEYEDYRAKTARWDPADDEITVMKFAARICNSHADRDANWGQPVAGLRCRWVTPAKKVQAGSAVVIGMEVENISGGRIFWQCRQGTWNICTPGSEPKDGSSTAPQFQIRPADGLRAATDEEAQMHHEGAGSAIGYYCLEPGARMTITAPYLWPLVESGRVEVNAFLWRVNPGGGGAYPMDHVHKNQMTCPPLVLEVVGGVDRQIIEGLSVWVSCDEARVEFAEDLKFTVRVENKSGREVELDSCGPGEDFPDLTLRMDSQESGRHILSTKKAGGLRPRRASRTIKNNEKKVREIRLSQLWGGYGGRPILPPGRYRVIANVGALTEQGGQIEVASAPTWLTISQWPWGKQVDGLQCSAVPEKIMWEAGETPTLEAKVRNVGSSPWVLPSLMELFYLETGGKLWHWRPDVSPALVNLEPGEGLEKTVRVTEDWVCSDDPNLRLKLSPGRHTIQFVILVAEPTEANVPPGTSQMPRQLTIKSNPVQFEILPVEAGGHFTITGVLKEGTARLRAATGIKRSKGETVQPPEKIEFLGLDLTRAPRTTDWAQLPELFEERPPGSKSYEIRTDVKVVFSWVASTVYYVPARDIFYVQHDTPVSSVLHYYGPFEGDPREVLDLEKEVKVQDRPAWGEAVIPDILASLKTELIEMSSTYPELVGARDIRIHGALEGTPLYGLDYIHNCKYWGKRGYEDAGPHATHIEFRITKRPEEGKGFSFQTQGPTVTWPNLNLVGWTRVHVGKGASPGFEAKVREVLQQHVKLINELDRRAKTITQRDVPAVEAEGNSGWGEAVDGLQCRLRADRSKWRAGETATLKADIRNRGTHQLSVVQHEGLCELWCDGRWYSWAGEISAKSSPLGAGRQFSDIPVSLDEHWVSKSKGKPLRLRRRHIVRLAFITESKQGEVIRVHSNPVQIEILPAKAGSRSPGHAAWREAEARRTFAAGHRRRISFLGLELTDAPRRSDRSELPGLFQERPAGSGNYALRDEVVAARHPEFWEEGVVYYAPAKKQFYIVEEPGHPSSGSKTFYGPFAGEPWKRFGMAEPRPVKKRYRFAIYLVVDPIDVGHPEDVTLEQLRLGSVPVLTEEDIVEYDWNEHFLKLTPEAWKRVPSPRSVWGLPFVVVADGHRCYLGAFWGVGSSYIPKVPVIGGFRPGWRENKIQISHRDPVAGEQDPRSDPRIRKVLKELKIVGATKERLKSADKLKGLGRALLMFANDHQGNYPDTLQELAQKNYMDAQDLKWLLENVQYHGEAKTAADPPNAVIAYDKTLLDRDNGTNVLFNDSHVAFARPEQLEKLGITRSFNKGNTPAARKRTANTEKKTNVGIEETKYGKMDVQTLLAKIRQAQTPTENVVMKWQGEIFVPIPAKREYAAFITGNRARWEYVQESYKRRIGAEPYHITQKIRVFDGDHVRQLERRIKQEYPIRPLIGTVKKSSHVSFMRLLRSSAFGCSSGLDLPETLRTHKMKLVDSNTPGIYLLDLISSNGDRSRFTVDGNRGYHIVKRESFSLNDGKDYEVNVALKKRSDGSWYPVSRESVRFSPKGGKELVVERNVLTKIEFGAEIPEETFTLQFPPGTAFRDEKLDAYVATSAPGTIDLLTLLAKMRTATRPAETMRVHWTKGETASPSEARLAPGNLVWKVKGCTALISGRRSRVDWAERLYPKKGDENPLQVKKITKVFDAHHHRVLTEEVKDGQTTYTGTISERHNNDGWLLATMHGVPAELSNLVDYKEAAKGIELKVMACEKPGVYILDALVYWRDVLKKTGPRHWQLTIDGNRGFNHVKSVLYGDDKSILKETNMTLRKYPGGIWYPARGERIEYSGDKVISRKQIEIKADFNADVPEDAFKLQFPLGTKVHDLLTQCEIVIGETGEQELMRCFESANTLRNLGKALMIYARDEGERKLPDTLERLYEGDYLSEKDLAWVLVNVEYLGRGKLSTDSLLHNVIAYDRTLPESVNGTNVLFLEGYVEFKKRQEFKKLGIAGAGNRREKKTATVQYRTAGDVSRQLEQVVELSVLRPDMTFAEALGHLKNSVKPPLVIVVLWRDVEVNADVHRITPINMDPISAVQLGAALELLLRSVSGREAELDYVVDDGVIVIATKESLPRKMETRVYDISALIGVRSKGGYRRQYYRTGQSYGGGSLGYMPGEYVHLPGGWGAMRRSDFNKLSNVRRPGPDGSQPPVPSARLFDERANEIRQCVIEITGPGSWAGEGGSGSIYVHENTKLIVRQTAENHQKIQMLLNEMRKAAGALVGIQSRLIFLPPDYSELQSLFKEEKLSFEPTVDDPNVSYCLVDSAQAGRLLKLAQGCVGSMVLTAPRLTRLSGESATLSFGGATADVHRPGELPADMPSRYVSLTFTPSIKQDSGDISLALTVAFDRVVGHKNYVIGTPLTGGAVAEQKQELPRTKEIWRLRTCQRVPEGKILLVKGQEFETQDGAGEVITKDLFILIETEELDPIRTE